MKKIWIYISIGLVVVTLSIIIFQHKKRPSVNSTKLADTFNMVVLDSSLIPPIKEYKLAEIMPYYDNGKWGYSNKPGEIVIPCQFDGCGFFNEGVAWVMKGEKFGFIDSTGKKVVDFKYDGAANFNNSLGPVKKGNLWGFIDKTGNMVIAPQFEDFRFSGKEQIHVMQNNQWGIIDRNGEPYILPIYDRDFEYEKGLAIVYRRQYKGLLNSRGKEIIECKYDVLTKAGKGCYVVGKRIKHDEYTYGLIDSTGSVRIPLTYARMENVNGEALIVSNGSDLGLINYRSDTLIPFKYKDMKWGNTNVIAAKGTLWGFITMKGDTLIPFIYSEAFAFVNQLAIVKYNAQYGMINIRGESIVPFNYDNITLISKNLIKVEKNKEYGFYSGSGSKLTECEFDNLDYHEKPDYNGETYNQMNFEILTNGYLIVGKKGRVGMINEKAEIVIPLKYHYIRSPDEHGLLVASYKNHFGLVDITGKELTELKYESLNFDQKSGFYFAELTMQSEMKSGFSRLINVGYFNFDGKFHSTSPYNTLHYDTEDVMIEKIKKAYDRINNEVKIEKAKIRLFEKLKGYSFENKLVVQDEAEKLKYEYYYDDNLNEYGPCFILISNANGKTTFDRYYFIHGTIVRHISDDGTQQLIDDAPYGPENTVHHQARKHKADFDNAIALSNKVNGQRVAIVDKMCSGIDSRIANGEYKRGDSDSQGMGEYQHVTDSYLDNKGNPIYKSERTSDEGGETSTVEYYTNGKPVRFSNKGLHDTYDKNTVGWFEFQYDETAYYYNGSLFRTIRDQNGITEIKDE